MASEFIKAEGTLRVGQRVEFYLEEGNERYASRIEDIKSNRLIVAMPMSHKRVPIIPHTGEKLYGLAVGEKCRWRFFTTFEKIDRLDGRLPVWQIAMPEKVERHQNREFVRVKVNLPVTVKIIAADGTIEAPQEARIVDLSGNGICFAWPSDIAIGTKAGIELHDIPGAGAMELMSQVVRVTPIADVDGSIKIYHVGAAFVNLPRVVSNKIVRYLFTIQRRSIAKGIDL